MVDLETSSWNSWRKTILQMLEFHEPHENGCGPSRECFLGRLEEMLSKRWIQNDDTAFWCWICERREKTVPPTLKKGKDLRSLAMAVRPSEYSMPPFVYGHALPESSKLSPCQRDSHHLSFWNPRLPDSNSCLTVKLAQLISFPPVSILTIPMIVLLMTEDHGEEEESGQFGTPSVW